MDMESDRELSHSVSNFTPKALWVKQLVCSLLMTLQGMATFRQSARHFLLTLKLTRDNYQPSHA